jgi:phosphoserine phosphatase
METHGNMYQRGFPDLYATHHRYGARWIEVKLPKMVGSKFTPAQLECFPKLRANGTRIWILTAATKEEYDKLFKPDNVMLYIMEQF